MNVYRFCAAATLAVVLGIASAVPAPAQQTESRIVGTVADQQGGILPGVTVSVVNLHTSTIRTVVTDTAGRYTITNLGPGNYLVEVTLDSFTPARHEVTLGVGDMKTTNVTLGVSGLSEAVTVTGDAPVLDLSSARIGVNVSPEEVKTLPVNGRNFANLMMLSTGAVSDGNGGWSSIRFNGKSNQQNYLNYDGVDGTYVFDANPGYLNVTGSQFRLQTSMESVAEFRVNSGLAPAESGLGTGGNITVVTKSGGNNFSGSAFTYRRDSAWDAASKFDGRKQPLEMDQFGGSIGGPMARGRTFFFTSYEGLRQTTGLSFTEAVPSEMARAMILSGTPTTTGGGRTPERTMAIAPLLAGFPTGGAVTNNALLSVLTADHIANQREDAVTGRVDHRINDNHTVYGRYLYSRGRLDTPDATVTARRILATQHPQNAVLNLQSLFGGNVVNEFKFGVNMPENKARTFSNQPGYPSEMVSLSGTVSSGSIDGRSTTGVAAAGLQIRQTSAASGGGLLLEPASYAFNNNLTWIRGAHTLKFGGEYRLVRATMNFLGGTTLSFGSVADFIDNRPSQVQVVEDSGDLTASQYYLIGYAQDTWRVTDRLTLDLGLRYEFYSVVREVDDRARPFIVGTGFVDPNRFYDADKNNIGPRLAAAWRPWDEKTVIRAGFGVFYGPGQFEDRIQPIENFITRYRATSGDVPTLQHPFSVAQLGNLQAIRAYTADYPHEYNIQYGASVQRELPGAVNLTMGYTGSLGRELFLRGVTNTFEIVNNRAVRPFAGISEIDFKRSGGDSRFDALQLSASRRFRAGFTGGLQYMLAKNTGTSQGSNEAATAANTFDFSTEQGYNASDVRHTFNGSMVYQLPGDGLLTGGWRVGGILNARSGLPINVTIQRADTLTVNGQLVANVPGGNQRGTQRPDLVPGVNPYLNNGRQWLNPAAFATPQPGTFGNLERNALRGPGFWQLDMVVSKDFRFLTRQAFQVRAEVFNIANRLNYANPPAALPNNGAPGIPFTETNVGPTFGLLTAPLNRTIGLGTARQAQFSVRYLF